jgi:hypothetical protein
VYCWFREVDPQGFTIRTLSSEIWLESQVESFRAEIKLELGKTPVLFFSMDGRRRTIDPKDFVRVLPGRAADSIQKQELSTRTSRQSSN